MCGLSAEVEVTGAAAECGPSGPARLSRVRVVAAAPAEAATTQQIPAHSAGDRCWLRTARPISAATAGWTDIQTPNRLVGMRRSASSSSQ
jgi:hypothetical protein